MYLYATQNSNQANWISLMANDYTISVGDTNFDMTSVVNSISSYNVTVDVIRITKVNGALGISETDVDIVNDLPCDIKWKTGREKILFDKETHLLDAVLHCQKPAGVDIVNTDKISYNSEDYEIVDVVDVNNLGVLLVIGIKKIT